MEHNNIADTIPVAALYIVATPIGNLDDITHRALSVLKSVNIIAAEDTRHTKILLQHFAINNTLFSLHDHNEQQKSDVLIEEIKKGKSIALVSDAGTPLINDPGYFLVKKCHEANIRVIPIPGACAAITALCASGLPSHSFCYEGFLPAKQKARLNALQVLQEETRTIIFYESPHRIVDCLQDIVQIFGENRSITLAREITKTWETITNKPAAELLEWVKSDNNQQRGEIVLVVEGYKKPDGFVISAQILQTLTLLKQELPLKKAAALTATIYGINKNALYKLGIEEKAE